MKVLFLFFIFQSILVIFAIGQPLSGTKVIGSGGDYATFTAAVNALVANGVSGPVIFNVKTGSYNEQISIGAVSGVSSTNTVTFRAQSLNAADVTLYYSPTSSNNYVVDLNEADYITFNNLTIMAQNSPSYGVVFRLRGDANNNNINHCILKGISGTTSSNHSVIQISNQLVDSLNIDNNTINDGGYALYFLGFNNLNPSIGIQFTNNIVNSSYVGINMQYVDNPIIRSNTFNNISYTGIQLQSCNKELNITKNKITGPTGYGIYLYSCIGGTGFPDGPGLIANNFVQCGSAYGINVYSSSNQNIYYNSVNATASNGYGYYGYANNTNVVVQNNIFANTAGGYAVYFGNANGATTMDYNNLYTTGNFIGLYGSTSTIDLDSWRTTSGKDTNSVSYYPGFVSSTDLHTLSPWLNGKAIVFADVTDDIDGNPRDGSTPDIGADEYTPSAGSMTPLSGTYTIGSGGNYTTFKSAVADLLLKGVSGPVTFNVLSGNYQEHIILYNIPGANATNTITFQSSTGNPANATLYFFAAAAESNYVVSMYNADYIRFRKMSLRANNNVGAQYGRVFVLNSGIDNFTLDSCIVYGTPTSSSSSNYTIINASSTVTRNITINGNTFNDGGYVIYLDGYDGTYLSTNTVITNNTMNNPDYMGVYLRYHNVPIISGNTIANVSSTGIQVNYGYNGMQILKNKITGPTGYGIYLYSCIGGTGFPDGPGLIANNFVQCGSAYGINVYSSSNQNIYYNSVNATASNGYGYYGYANNTNVVVQNNIFANTAGGYAVYFGNANGATTMDYNNLYTTGNFIGLYGSTSTIDLDSWRTTSGKDTNSVSYYPGFVSSTDLHTLSPWLNGKAIVFADVTDDIDGNPRDGSTPDIGADEYTPSAGSMTPLSGTYTIGSGGNYTTFKSAVADLLLKGVSGPVTFNVLSGTYNEHFVIYNVPGASRVNTITFQSQSGNPTGTVIYYPATSADSNYVVMMYQADYFRFKNLTFRANTSTSSQYGRIFNIYGNVDNLILEGNRFESSPNSSNSSAFAIINNNQAVLRSLNIIGNTFYDGGYAMYLDGQSANYSSDSTVISGNTINNPDYTGIYLQYHNAPIIEGNTIINPTSRGIEVQYSNNGLRVVKNKIYDAGYIGIYIYSCTGGVSGSFLPGLIANNFVHAKANSYGIDIYSSANQKIYHNSVNITGANSYAYYGYNNTTNVIVQNNIFANTGGGYAVYFAYGNGATTSDYNDLYTTGTYLGYTGSANVTDLAAWRSATGKDGFSISTNPQFYSATNLHVYSALLDSSGIPVPEVTDDFDGEPRNTVKPDIGADEFSVIHRSITNVQSGWNMVSLPVVVQDNRKIVLFPTAISKAFAYLPTGYTLKDSIDIGVGYWLKFPSDYQNIISGYPKLLDTIHVNSGWNMIGTIAYPIPKTAVTSNTTIISPYFGYSTTSGYIVIDTLKPGKAYWVKTSSAGNLILDVNNTKMKTTANSNPESLLEQLNQITFGAAGANRDGEVGTKLYFGTVQEKDIELDQFSLPPIPPEDMTDVRFPSGRFVELLSNDNLEHVKIPISIRGNNVNLQLSWNIKQTSERSYILVEREGNKIISKRVMNQTGSILIKSNGKNEFTIESEALPKQFALYQNYPNPFNPQTRIDYSLPEAAHVKLVIYDVVGREVAKIVDEVQEAGYKSVTFDASALPSGVYYYRLQAGTFTDVKKMLLLK